MRAAFSAQASAAARRAARPLVLVPELMALVPVAGPPGTRAPSRSRSPPAGRGQRCSIAVDEAEVDEFMRKGVVNRSWFGDRKGCVPVKTQLGNGTVGLAGG